MSTRVQWPRFRPPAVLCKARISLRCRTDIPVDSLARFSEAWRKRGYRFHPAARPGPKSRDPYWSFGALAGSAVQLEECLDATRFAATLAEVPRQNGYCKLLAAGLYGNATNLAETKVLVDQLICELG